jgi:hypothetical protein
MKTDKATGPSGFEDDGLKPEYRLDYSKAKPNRFAKQMAADTVAVVLEPDVVVLFGDSEAVNAALRGLAAKAR